MNKMGTSPACCKTVYGGGRGFMGGRCDKRGKVLSDGKWYCTIHSPEYVAKRDAEMRERWAKQDQQAREERKRKQQEADLVKACHERGIYTVEHLQNALKEVR